MEEYLQDCRENIALVLSALERLPASGASGEDAAALFVFAHRMAGSGGTYGFDKVTEAAYELEEVMKEVKAGRVIPDASACARIRGLIGSIEGCLGLSTR